MIESKDNTQGCEWCQHVYHEDYMRYGIINSSEELGWVCNKCDEENEKDYNEYWNIKASIQYDIEGDR